MTIPTPLIVPYTPESCTPTPPFPNQTVVWRPAVKTVLEHSNARLPYAFLSVIDSGADYCVFPAVFGEAIGIDVKNGKSHRAQGVAGGDTAYFHNVQVWVEIGGQPYYFSCWAGFMYSLESLGLLGRQGFFGLFESITFKDEAQMVELVPKQPIAQTPPSPTVAS